VQTGFVNPNGAILMRKLPTAFEVFQALLRRFPKWTHRFWFYLMALRPPGTTRHSRWTAARHLVAVLLVYLGATALGIWSISVLLDAGQAVLMT
jgi:hypothetical protein